MVDSKEAKQLKYFILDTIRYSLYGKSRKECVKSTAHKISTGEVFDNLISTGFLRIGALNRAILTRKGIKSYNRMESARRRKFNGPAFIAFPSDEGLQAETWCPFCKKFHYHGFMSGTRVPHCDRTSSRPKSRFNVEEAFGEYWQYWVHIPSDTELKRIAKNINKYLSLRRESRGI